MKCEAVRELIGTSYADGCASAGERHDVETHIMVCELCKQYLHDIVDLRDSVRIATREDPPKKVWEGIERRLDEQHGLQGQPVSSVWAQVRDLLLGPLLHPRPVLVWSAVIVALLMISVSVGGYYYMFRVVPRQQAVDELLLGPAFTSSIDFGTSIEQLL